MADCSQNNVVYTLKHEYLGWINDGKIILTGRCLAPNPHAQTHDTNKRSSSGKTTRQTKKNAERKEKNYSSTRYTRKEKYTHNHFARFLSQAFSFILDFNMRKCCTLENNGTVCFRKKKKEMSIV